MAIAFHQGTSFFLFGEENVRRNLGDIENKTSV